MGRKINTFLKRLNPMRKIKLTRLNKIRKFREQRQEALEERKKEALEQKREILDRILRKKAAIKEKDPIEKQKAMLRELSYEIEALEEKTHKTKKYDINAEIALARARLKHISLKRHIAGLQQRRTGKLRNIPRKDMQELLALTRLHNDLLRIPLKNWFEEFEKIRTTEFFRTEIGENFNSKKQ